MILSDVNLRAAIEDGHLVVDPLAIGAVQPNSIDLRLGPELLVATPAGFCPHHLIDDGPLKLHQLMFVLGSTLEWVEIADDLAGFVSGKSSRAREGVQIESAGLVDAGWKGHLTLEIVMLSPLPTYLMVGEMIAQLHVHRLLTRAARPYGSDGVGRYQHSRGPVPSRAVVGRAS